MPIPKQHIIHLLKRFLREVVFYAELVVIALLLAIALRLFVFSSFHIPTPSMEPAVLAGDYVLVNKLAHGPRIVKNFRFLKGGKFETFRLKGFSRVKRNDVVVFNFPYTHRNKLQPDLSVYYLKRCVALPGDTFFIANGHYGVKNVPDSIGCVFRQRELAQKSQEDFREIIWKCFPHNTLHYQWTIKDFGPLYVPKAGDGLVIDTVNYVLYKNLIAYETDQALEIKNGKVCLGDSSIGRYTFQLNYYFMAGDLIRDSRDSRYWGLLPEDHIVGKAAVIWQSKDIHTGKRRWKRTLKTIR